MRMAAVSYSTNHGAVKREKLSAINLSLENNLPMFRLNAPVVIRVKVKKVCLNKRCWL